MLQGQGGTDQWHLVGISTPHRKANESPLDYWRDDGYVELHRLHGQARMPTKTCDQGEVRLSSTPINLRQRRCYHRTPSREHDEQRVTAKDVVTLDASRKLARSVETSNGPAICTNDAGVQIDSRPPM